MNIIKLKQPKNEKKIFFLKKFTIFYFWCGLIIFVNLINSKSFAGANESELKSEVLKEESIHQIKNIENKETQSTNQNSTINVHVIPHTHDDAGWLWTYLEYYQGTGGSPASVERILDNFILSLYENKNRTFIYVEMAFFVRWYKSQKDSFKKEQIKQFLKEKRFEFINGGYVMHDEATTYYQDMIDQMRLGLLFLKQEFDFVPEVAWSIDPFGHSATNAYLMAKMGFKKIAFVRIDAKEKEYRKKNKSLEFYWFPYENVNTIQSLTYGKFNNLKRIKIFTHITFDHYCPPSSMSGFVSEKDLNLNETEIIERSVNIIKDLNLWNSGYNHNSLMLMYGCDFTFDKKDNNFLNLERVMDYINNNYDEIAKLIETRNLNINKLNDTNRIEPRKIKLQYSTPSKYFEEIFMKVDSWPSFKNHDFFPYGDYPYSYWSGFFTSRPYLKGLVRETGNYLRTFTKYTMELILKNNIEKNKKQKTEYIDELINSLFSIREILAICQHHDAVAGTAKEKVSENYIELMRNSTNLFKRKFLNQSSEIIDEITNVCIEPTVDENCIQKLFISNKSQSNDTENINFNLYNPGFISRESRIINIDIKNADYFLINKKNNKIISSDNFCYEIMSSTNDTSYNRCKMYFEHNFNRKEIFSSFTLRKKSNLVEKLASNNRDIKKNKRKYLKTNNKLVDAEDNIIYNITKNIILNINKSSSEIFFEWFPDNFGIYQTYKYNLSHGFYNPYKNNNSLIKPPNVNPDGAYVLSTTELYPDFFELNLDQSYVEYGNISVIVFLKFKESAMIINHYISKENFIEINSIWNPFNKGGDPQELLMILKSDLNNMINPEVKNLRSSEKGFEKESIFLENTTEISKKIKEYNKINDNNLDRTSPEFWTDSNGINIIRRVKDYRDSYPYEVTEPVASNFYPINSLISIREKNKKNNHYSKNKLDGFDEKDRIISILTDRSQSGGLMQQGEIMLIHNRFSSLDDWKGLDESLYENNSLQDFFKVRNFIVFNSGKKEQNLDDIEYVNELIHKKWMLIQEKDDERLKQPVFHDLRKDIYVEDNSIVESTNVLFSNKGLYTKKQENYSILEDLISHSKNILINYHILDQTDYFIQFFNNCLDYYTVDGCDDGNFRFNSLKGLNYQVEEYNLNGSPISNNKLQKRTINLKDSFINLDPMEFRLFKISLK